MVGQVGYKMGVFHPADFVLGPCELVMSDKVVQQLEMAHFLGFLVSVLYFQGHSAHEVRSNS